MKMEDRRLADVTISHEGQYAIAVCQALDELHVQDSTPIIDTSNGEPLHEPQYGDQGFESET